MVDQSLPAGAGRRNLIAGLMRTNHRSVAANSRSLDVRAAIDAEPGPHAEADSHGLVVMSVRRGYQRLVLCGQSQNLIVDVELADQSLPIGVGCCSLIAGLGHMNRRRRSVEVKSQDLTVWAAIVTERCLHAEADDLRLAKIVGQGLTTEVADHQLPAMTRGYDMELVVAG